MKIGIFPRWTVVEAFDGEFHHQKKAPRSFPRGAQFIIHHSKIIIPKACQTKAWW
jgi:hypothetical protein